MSNDSKVASRPIPTPRVVNILRQLAFDRKERGPEPVFNGTFSLVLDDLPGENPQLEEQATKQVEKKLTLTQAKDIVAVEFGFENWQHVKRLAKQYESIVPKRSLDLRQDYVFKIALSLYLDYVDRIPNTDEDEDVEDDSPDDGHISFNELTEVLKAKGPPTEAVTFALTLTLESKADRSQTEIGQLDGAFYFHNKKNSLFLAFDAESGDLASFAEDFECSFSEEETGDISDLAYVNSVYVAEGYDEGEFLRMMVDGLYQYVEPYVDAIYLDPAPVVKMPNPRNMASFWDCSKGRKESIASMLSASKFEVVGEGPYLVRRTWRW